MRCRISSARKKARHEATTRRHYACKQAPREKLKPTCPANTHHAKNHRIHKEGPFAKTLLNSKTVTGIILVRLKFGG